MVSSENKDLVARLQKLSEILRLEQRRLVEEAANSDGLPNNGILRQIAELELNIVAVENNMEEIKAK